MSDPRTAAISNAAKKYQEELGKRMRRHKIKIELPFIPTTQSPENLFRKELITLMYYFSAPIRHKVGPVKVTTGLINFLKGQRWSALGPKTDAYARHVSEQTSKDFSIDLPATLGPIAKKLATILLGKNSQTEVVGSSIVISAVVDELVEQQKNGRKRTRVQLGPSSKKRKKAKIKKKQDKPNE